MSGEWRINGVKAPDDATHWGPETPKDINDENWPESFYRMRGDGVWQFSYGANDRMGWRGDMAVNHDWLERLGTLTPRVAPSKPLDTGLKYDAGKVLMGLIPPRAELAMAQVLTFGAAKYGPDNWRRVENAQQRYLDALMRHLNSHRSGELLDAETGLSHLAHAMCCMSFLLELQLVGEGE